VTHILAVDTSTAACSVALTINNNILEDFAVIPREHNLKILSIIDRLLAKHHIQLNQLDALAYNCGPGSFTGLRIASALIQGLSLAYQLPIIGVSSLQALALAAQKKFSVNQCLCILPARANLVYCSRYNLHKDNHIPVLEGKEQMITIDEISTPVPQQDYAIVGNLSAKLQENLILHTNTSTNAIELDAYPHAADIAYLAGAIFKADNTSFDAIPNYINNQVTY
jgi:tRNA threonylcarbamoyladenosine biosynthesis protein TsaB